MKTEEQWAEEQKPIPIDILMRVIDLNEAIVKQNELIVQMLTLPSLIIKGDKNENQGMAQTDDKAGYGFCKISGQVDGSNGISLE